MSNKIQQLLKLPPVRTAPFFAAGILLCANGGTVSVVIMAVAVVLSFLVLHCRRGLLLSVLALLLGMFVVSSHILFVVRPLEGLDGTEKRVALHITEQYDGEGYSYCECVTFIDGIPAKLSFYTDQDITTGDRVDAKVRLTVAVHNGKASREQVLKASVVEIYELHRPAFSLSRSISDYRYELQQEISGHIQGDAGALAQGMLFGDTSDLSTKLYHAAKVSGIVHFTAVSGTHFVIIMAVLLEIAGDRKRLRSILALIFVPVAVMFFGGEPSVLRAGIMVFLCNCGPLFSRKAETLNSLCVAVLAMTVFTPYVMTDIGFQMSVLGVFGVSVAGPRCSRMLRRYTRKLPELLRSAVDAMTISACAVICIAPVSVTTFGGISLTGVFATLVLTPVFSAALTLAVVFAITGLTPLLIPVGLLMQAAYHIIMFFGGNNIFWLPMDYRVAGLIAVISAVALVAAAVFYNAKREYSVAALIFCIIIAFSLNPIAASRRRTIDLISDGTSGAAVICIEDEAAVLLCGSGADIGSKLTDILLRNGTDRIAYVFAEDLSEKGAYSLITLSDIYEIKHIYTNTGASSSLCSYLKSTEISTEVNLPLTIDGITLDCAKAGDTDTAADIVLYYSYKLSEPLHSAKLPLYVSSRQDILPENGMNIYDTPYKIDLMKREKYYG